MIFRIQILIWNNVLPVCSINSPKHKYVINKREKICKAFLGAQESCLTLTKSSSRIHRPRYPSVNQRYYSNSQQKLKFVAFLSKF